MSEKKATGIQKPLNVSAALAKIIGTKKGEQVTQIHLQVGLVFYNRYFHLSIEIGVLANIPFFSKNPYGSLFESENLTL